MNHNRLVLVLHSKLYRRISRASHMIMMNTYKVFSLSVNGADIFQF